MKVSFEEGIADKVAIEQHLEQVVGIVVVEDDSFSVSTWVVGHVVDGASPNADELGHVTGQLAKMVDVLKE